MEGPPPGTDLSASQVGRILGVNIATFCLAVIAIILRFIARRLTRAVLWWDDWLMLPAIVSCKASFVTQQNKCGLGFCCLDVLYIHNLQ